MFKISLILVLLVINTSSFSQIKKGNWLVGGNASFSSFKSTGSGSIQYTQNIIQLNPVIGYFLKNNFTAGLKPSFIYASTDVGGGSSNSSTTFNIGPFLRYYFLKADTKFNIFSEVGYEFGTNSDKAQTTNTSSSRTFSVAAGPVVYFNSSIGLEFIIGYATTTLVGYPGSTHVLSVGIGFQIHLKK